MSASRFKTLARIAAVCSILLALSAPEAEARGGGGGGRARFEDFFRPKMKWHDSLSRALMVAGGESPALPVMCFLRKAAGVADKRYTNGIFQDRNVVDASRAKIAAYRVDINTAEGRELAKQHKIKRDGVLLWLDEHGNVVWKTERTLRVNDVTGVPLQWKAILERTNAALKKKLASAQRLIDSKQYASSLNILQPLMQLEGPIARDANALVSEIEGRGDQMLKAVGAMAQSAGSRRLLLSAVARQFKGCSVAERAKEMIDNPEVGQEEAAPQVTEAEAVAAGEALGETAPPEPEPEPAKAEVKRPKLDLWGDDDSSTTTVTPPPAPPPTRIVEKPSPPMTVAKPTEPAIPPAEALAKAKERYQEGKSIYVAASRTNNSDGYRRAFRILTEASDLAEKALLGNPKSAAIEGLLEDITLLRYSCLKYQTL